MQNHPIQQQITRCLGILAIFLLVPMVSTGQESAGIIKWVGQYPDKNTGKKTGILKKIGNIILGPRANILGKPVNMYAEDPESLWILSQSNGTVVNYKDGISEPSISCLSSKPPFAPKFSFIFYPFLITH